MSNHSKYGGQPPFPQGRVERRPHSAPRDASYNGHGQGFRYMFSPSAKSSARSLQGEPSVVIKDRSEFAQDIGPSGPKAEVKAGQGLRDRFPRRPRGGLRDDGTRSRRGPIVAFGCNDETPPECSRPLDSRRSVRSAGFPAVTGLHPAERAGRSRYGDGSPLRIGPGGDRPLNDETPPESRPTVALTAGRTLGMPRGFPALLGGDTLGRCRCSPGRDGPRW